MRSSFLSFAPDVSKEQCQAEHWIDIENVSESVKMTPEEIENLNARILRTYGTEMHDLKKEAFAKEERVVYDKWCGNFLSFGIQGINWTVRDAQNSVDKNVHIKYGIATSQGLIKQFPMETFLADEEDPSDPEWDEAALCLCMVGEALLILGSVQEEGYLYVRNECSEGWISAESVAVCRNRAEWLMAAFPIHPLVVTGDMVWLEASAVYPGTSAYRLRMGTVLELCVEEEIPEIKETIETNRIKGTGALIETTEAQAEQRVQNRLSWNNYIVWLPCRAPDGSFFRQKGLIPMSRDVSVGYLSLTNEEIIKQAFKCLGDRYGWGGMLESRDCSSYIREVYRCFGWILPRNTTGQLQMPVRKIELAGRRCSEKKQILKVLEPGTLLYFPGHVMMYLGYENGNFYVINDVSRLVKEGETMPVRVRSVIVNTLAVRRPNLRTWMEELTLALIPWET